MRNLFLYSICSIDATKRLSCCALKFASQARKFGCGIPVTDGHFFVDGCACHFAHMALRRFFAQSREVEYTLTGSYKINSLLRFDFGKGFFGCKWRFQENYIVTIFVGKFSKTFRSIIYKFYHLSLRK